MILWYCLTCGAETPAPEGESPAPCCADPMRTRADYRPRRYKPKPPRRRRPMSAEDVEEWT